MKYSLSSSSCSLVPLSVDHSACKTPPMETNEFADLSSTIATKVKNKVDVLDHQDTPCSGLVELDLGEFGKREELGTVVCCFKLHSYLDKNVKGQTHTRLDIIQFSFSLARFPLGSLL